MESLMTTTELAEILRLHPKTVGDLARKGKIPCIEVGGGKSRRRVRFDRRQVAEALGISIERPA